MLSQLVVLLHVNRSGSTYLSRLISDAFDDMFVFPELAFPFQLFVERALGRRLGGAELASLIAADPRRDALKLAPAELETICRRFPDDPPQFFAALAEAAGGRADRRVMVLKLERLIQVDDAIKEAFPDRKVIHLVRDPRAVVASMLRSPVPEKPGFNMARGSVVYAARAWRAYVAAVERLSAADDVLTIRYEDLSRDEPGALVAIGAFLGVEPNADRRGGSRYGVAALDGALHPHIHQPFRGDRLASWLSEADLDDVAIVERLCAAEMRRFGYAPSGRAAGAGALAKAYGRHLVATASHYGGTLALYARGVHGPGAAGRRFRAALAVAKGAALSWGRRSRLASAVLSRVSRGGAHEDEVSQPR